MPINITQESHERAKRSAAAAGLAGRRAKRQRLASPPAAPAPAPAPAPAQHPPIHLAPRVLFSALPVNLTNKLAAIIRYHATLY